MEKIQYVERMWSATYPYGWDFYDEPEGLEDSSDIYKEALEEHGEVFARQLVGVSKSHLVLDAGPFKHPPSNLTFSRSEYCHSALS